MVGTPLAGMTSLLKPRQPQGPLPTLRASQQAPQKNHLCFATLLNPFATISHGCWSLTGGLDVAREFLEWGNSTTATGQSCTTCAAQAPNGAKSTTGCQRDLPKSESWSCLIRSG